MRLAADMVVGETASMFVRQNDDRRDWMKCLMNFEELQKMDWEFRLPPNSFWTPNEGLMQATELLKLYEVDTGMSQVTKKDADEEHDRISDTLPVVRQCSESKLSFQMPP